MQDALKERIANATWNLKMFEDSKQNPNYYYLVGMALADLRVASDILEELNTNVA